MSPKNDSVGSPSTTDLWETYWGDEDNHDWWEQPAPEVLRFIDSQSPEEVPAVLDLGCGLGRHAIAFARAGFCVTALDTSDAAVAHLGGWSRKLGLSVDCRTGDAFNDRLAAGSFDIVLSYNVIYHGRRHEFAGVIRRVRELLKPGGLFFFTCPTRRDGKYGQGEQVEPHTFLCTNSITPGDTHYFSDKADLDDMLAGFRLLKREPDDHYWDNRGERMFHSYWQVLAEKE
jgi:SAM-dependent methyltransferase